jgi:hypothetical protein
MGSAKKAKKLFKKAVGTDPAERRDKVQVICITKNPNT